MVESVKELRKICKKKGIEEKGLSALYRYVSFYLTKLLLYLPLNANQVSIIGVEVGIIASIFFLFGNPINFIFGGIWLFFHMLFDYSDGEIARYYKIQGGLGGFFDWSNCLPRVLIIIFLTLTFIVNMPSFHRIFIILFGFISSVFWLYNNIFWGLRNNLANISIEDNDFDIEIHKKLMSSFEERYLKIINKIYTFIKNLLKKFRITYFSKKNLKKKNLINKIRIIVRRSQSGISIPFLFIFTGLADIFLTSSNNATFSLWIYYGISGIILFFLEEIFIIDQNVK